MEPKRKIGGEGLRNGDNMNEDMISELPEALLLHILSSLPTETAIATSVLSKRWKSLWKMVPNLNFDSDHHHQHRFAENVCNSLLLHNAPESLNLTLQYRSDVLEMGIWIAIAFSRKVRELVIKLEIDEEDEPILFPNIVFRCKNTLETLKLYSILFDFASPVCLNSLREMHLYYIRFKDEESVSNLFCGCPQLQVLVIYQQFIDFNTFTIAVPSLQRLALTVHNETENGRGYVIKAPSLKFLTIDRFEGLDFCMIENTPDLVEARVTEAFYFPRVLESLISAKRLSLSLSPLTIKYPAGKIFYQLLSLELFTNEKEWWDLLTLMLDSSPKLQILKLIKCKLEFDFSGEDCSTSRKWSKPKCVPECLLYHLRTFVWTRYEWEQEDEKEVATYILKNSRNLTKATLTTEHIKPTELKKLEKRHKMLEELAAEVKVPDSCHLVFKSEARSVSNSLDIDLDYFN